MRTSLRVGVLMAIFVLAFSAAGSLRADDETGWKIRVDLAFLDPGGDALIVDVGDETIATSLDSGGGVGVAAEYRFSRRLGVEFGVLAAASVDLSSGIFGPVFDNTVEIASFTPVTVGLDVHLTPGKAVDLYLGPQLSWVGYSGVNVSTGLGGTNSSLDLDSDVGPGAIVGVDVPIGQKGWLFQANFRMIDTNMKRGGTSPLDVEFDPRIFSLGFGYRF